MNEGGIVMGCYEKGFGKQALWRVNFDNKVQVLIPTMKICIVGAGASGLSAAKCCLDEGVTPVVIEQSGCIGGLWVFTEEESHSSVYRTTIINTSSQMTSFSDHPADSSYATFMHNTEIVRYLSSYCDDHAIRQHIRFHTTVLSVEPLPHGKWKVSTRKTGEAGDPTTASEVFDGVMLCSGHHWNPRVPHFPGKDDFKGMQMHSHSYKDPDPFKDKTVAVVGIGNSGGDLAVELSRSCRHVYLSTRSGSWVFPRFGLQGHPLDWFPNRFNSALPDAFQDIMARIAVSCTIGSPDVFGLRPKHTPFGAHPTVNSELYGRIGTGMVSVKPNIKRFTADGVEFVDGSWENVDAVIYATGYIYSLPYLKDVTVFTGDNEVGLYRLVTPPDHPTLACIGMIQPLGSIFPISEMQARWYLAHMLQRLQFPSRDAMLEEISERRSQVASQYKKSPRHTVQVRHYPYMNEFASDLGVRPSLWRVATHHPSLLGHFLFGPLVPYWYRLFGHGKWDGAADAIRNTSVQGTPHSQKAVVAKASDDNTCSSRAASVFKAMAVFAVISAGLHKVDLLPDHLESAIDATLAYAENALLKMIR
eukprot:Rmarinus@m.18496